MQYIRDIAPFEENNAIWLVDLSNLKSQRWIEMFYLNTIDQLFLFIEQLDQLEVCLPYSRLRLLTGIPILAVFQNLMWNSNKTSLCNNVNLSNYLSNVSTSVHKIFMFSFLLQTFKLIHSLLSLHFFTNHMLFSAH